jgi:hypothetical protein
LVTIPKPIVANSIKKPLSEAKNGFSYPNHQT